MGVCNCSMFCCMLLYVHSSIAIILMGKRELVALLNLSSRCLVMVERLFLAVPRGCLRFVSVVFPDHTHYFVYKLIPKALIRIRGRAVRYVPKMFHATKSGFFAKMPISYCCCLFNTLYSKRINVKNKDVHNATTGNL